MTRQTTPAVGEEFLKNKEKIREFCERPTHTGGVLLVTGTRGTGKTRLVDEAINNRDSEWQNQRLEVERQPRGLQRFLVKVDVDPNFPHPKIVARDDNEKKDDDKKQAPPDENELAFILIRNIVFALTSVIDCRFSLRRHGKTLYERLGFWRYWFAYNALLVEHVWLKAVGLIALLLSLTCLLHYGLFAKWLYIYTLQAIGTDSSQLTIQLTISLLTFFTSIVIILLAWMFLRWLDLHALARMSADLYDLVHAQEKSQNSSHESEDKTELTSKLPWFLLVIVLAWVWVDPPVIDFLRGTSATNDKIDTCCTKQAIPPISIQLTLPEKYPCEPKENPCQPEEPPEETLCKYEKTPEQPPCPGDKPKKPDEEEGLSETVQALIVIAGTFLTFLFTRTRKTNNQNHAKFGNKNPVWMITLLRRYLYLCHRCGLEPVLVIDELDKLEDIGYWMKHQKHKKHPHESPVIDKDSDEISKLGMFLMAITRLKSSLGAEFLWILISGPRLYDYLQADRHGDYLLDDGDEHKYGSLGLLATVIQQDIALGPISCATAEQHNGATDATRVLWLRSRGNFSTIKRTTEAREQPIFTVFQQNLVTAVNGIWLPEEQKDVLGLTDSIQYEEKLKSEWVQAWIHAGMLEIANHFIKQPIPYDYFANALEKAMLEKYGENLVFRIEIAALFTNDPRILRLLGERVFYRYIIRKMWIERPSNSGDYVRFIADFTHETVT